MNSLRVVSAGKKSEILDGGFVCHIIIQRKQGDTPAPGRMSVALLAAFHPVNAPPVSPSRGPTHTKGPHLSLTLPIVAQAVGSDRQGGYGAPSPRTYLIKKNYPAASSGASKNQNGKNPSPQAAGYYPKGIKEVSYVYLICHRFPISSCGMGIPCFCRC
jgi:hypothetical protein